MPLTPARGRGRPTRSRRDASGAQTVASGGVPGLIILLGDPFGEGCFVVASQLTRAQGSDGVLNGCRPARHAVALRVGVKERDIVIGNAQTHLHGVMLLLS